MALVHAAFVLTGIATTLGSPILPYLVARWSLSDAQAGTLFTMQFAGSMTGTAAAGWLTARLGFRRLLAVAALLMAVGIDITSMVWVTWPAGLGCFFVLGLGLGIAIPGSNLFVAEFTARRPASALSLLNLAWGAGAIIAPPLVSAAGDANTGSLLLAFSVMLIATAVAALFVRWPSPHATAGEGQAIAPGRAHWQPALLLAVLLFLYVGTEAAYVGWAAVYGERLAGGASRLAVMMPSFFWVTFLLGRGGAPLVLRRISEIMLLRAGLMTALAGMAIAVLFTRFAAAALGSALAGLGCAAVFPLLVAMMTHRFSARKGLVSVLFLAGSFGGAVLPWLTGFTSSAASALRAGMLVPLAATALLLALSFSPPLAAGNKPAPSR